MRFGNGFDITAAAGRDDPDRGGRDNPTFVYGKLGDRMEMFELDRTALALALYVGKGIGADGEDPLAVGVFAVQNIDLVATELHPGYRYHELDRDGFDLDPGNAVTTGARIEFRQASPGRRAGGIRNLAVGRQVRRLRGPAVQPPLGVRDPAGAGSVHRGRGGAGHRHRRCARAA